ncbi:hypothetical protein MMC26_006122 [Xylographa opegraphella]|nr:hypothetical protein [Xylographa opegraphella]
MLPSGHPSDSLQHLPHTPTSFIEPLPRYRSTTTPSTHRPRPPSPRRRAVTDIDLRHIGEGKMSAFSSTEQLSSFSPDLSRRPSSRDTRSSGISQWEDVRPDGLARSLLTKSSRLLLRRKNGKLGQPSTRTLEWLEDTEDVTTKHVQELSKRRKSKHSRIESSDYGILSGIPIARIFANASTEHMLKHSISGPYNFQHLTHTAAHQAKALKTASAHDLVTEFSAIRASQAPRPELKGIKADSLEERKRSMWIESPGTVSDTNSMVSTSPTRLRHQGSESSRFGGPENKNIRYSKSTDSFTRAVSRSFNSPTPPLSPPPRRSSRMAMTLPITHPLPLQDPPIAPASGADSQLISSMNPPKEINAADDREFRFDLTAIAQAVTTPDDTAYVLGNGHRGSPVTGLADVPEEDEVISRIRNSISSRPPTANSIRHTKSFPSAEFSITKSSSNLPRIQSDMQMSLYGHCGTTSDPTLPVFNEPAHDIPIRPRMSRRISTGIKGLDTSWEDDIDFCYEHAAEADSAFDWQKILNEEINPTGDDAHRDSAGNTSNFGQIMNFPLSPPSELTDETETPLALSERPSSYFSTFQNSSRPMTLMSETTSTSGSLWSSSVSMPGAITPAEPAFVSQTVTVPRTSSGTMMFPLSPSLLIPTEYVSRVTHEETFHHKLTDRDSSKGSYLTYNTKSFEVEPTHHYSTTTSSPLRKSTSQESALPGGTPSVGSHHYTTSSVGSLPELVHSGTRREKGMFAHESLADHIALLNIGKHPAKLGMIVDATRQKFIRDATTAENIEEEEAPIVLPVVHPRPKASSESISRSSTTAQPMPLESFTTTRNRSSSVGTALSGKSKSTRTSYSLFPTVAAR